MTPSAAFFESVINVEHTLCRLKLRPLCLAHLLWLYAVKSPLVETERPVTLADLEIAALICSSRSEAQIALRLGVSKQSLFLRARLGLWRLRNSKLDSRTEAKRFLAYQEDYIALPETEESNGEDEVKLPWLLMHAAACIAATGWKESEVYFLPLGRLLWLNMAFGYLKTGKSTVISEKELNAREALKSLYSRPL